MRYMHRQLTYNNLLCSKYFHHVRNTSTPSQAARCIRSTWGSWRAIVDQRQADSSDRECDRHSRRTSSAQCPTSRPRLNMGSCRRARRIRALSAYRWFPDGPATNQIDKHSKQLSSMYHPQLFSVLLKLIVTHFIGWFQCNNKKGILISISRDVNIVDSRHTLYIVVCVVCVWLWNCSSTWFN